MSTSTPVLSSLGSLRGAAAIFGALFLMSGAEGQQSVQLVFLLLAAGCWLLQEALPQCGEWWQRRMRAHPQLRVWLAGGRFVA